jgi:hypothetical protein
MRSEQQLSEVRHWWHDKGERWGSKSTLESYSGIGNISDGSSLNFTIKGKVVPVLN